MRLITIKTSMALMMAMVISGCGSDLLERPTGDGMVPVEVKHVLSFETDITESRAAQAVTSNGSKMGVFRIGDSKYTAQNNVEFTYNSSTGKWTNSTSTPILVGVAATTLCAYYPFSSVAFGTGMTATTATLTAQKYDATKDMSYATSAASTVNNQTPDATFAMKHAYARIKMAINRHATNCSGDCNISTVNVKNNTSFFTTNTLNITSGSYGSNAATDGGWTYALNTGNMSAGSTNNKYDVLVPPQPVGSGLTITLTVDGSERAVTIPATQFSSNLNAGSQYAISLLLTDTEVIPNGNISITDWVIDNTTLQGNVDFGELLSRYRPIQVPESDINLGGTGCTSTDKQTLSQLKWASGNLHYEWAAIQSDYGYYYTWNSTFGGESSTTLNNTDPCSKLDESKYGSGWRTPNKVEMEMLSRCTDKALTNGGMWFMNKTKGLFLPAAGYRGDGGGSGTTATHNIGTSGNYWSSDAYNSSNGYYLYFSNGYAGVYNTYGRVDGFTVRCVQGTPSTPIVIQVPVSDINLGGNGCTSTDKQSLSLLKWARGNLKSTDNSKPYEWAASQSDYGYYYTWNSTFGGEGSTAVNNTDPCSKLDVVKYGSGWRTPNKVEMEMLSRCTDKALTDGGMWFMNKTNGLFLPAAGFRYSNEGSGTTATSNVGTHGSYWSSDAYNSSNGYFLSFYSGYASVNYNSTKSYGLSVRCVQGTPSTPSTPLEIQVSASDINLGGDACTPADKQGLSKLKWARGNLKSTDNSKPYEWAASQSDYGYYYTWNSTFGGEGSTAVNNTDPCSKLDVVKYGSGWRTPRKVEMEMLSRCTDKVLTNGGMWFMNKTNGLFLPAAGRRNNNGGSGTTATGFVGMRGLYWSRDAYNSGYGYNLDFTSGTASGNFSSLKADGFPVRCVK